MKNVEMKKEEIENVINQIVAFDNEQQLLRLIKNNILRKNMIYSSHVSVREQLAKHLDFIEQLIFDKEPNVRIVALRTIINNKNNDSFDFDKYMNLAIKKDDELMLIGFIDHNITDERMTNSTNSIVINKLINKGLFLNVLIKKTNIQINNQIYQYLIDNNKLKKEHIDYILEKDYLLNIFLLIKNDIFDSRMLLSKHYEVRCELASKGEFINLLICDSNKFVRLEAYSYLIKHNRKNEISIDYEIIKDDLDVLEFLIENKIFDKRMCKSKHYKVREKLARNGLFIDFLFYDKNHYVVQECLYYLIKNNLFIGSKYYDYIKDNIDIIDENILFFLIENDIFIKEMLSLNNEEINIKLSFKGSFTKELIKNQNPIIRNYVYQYLKLSNQLNENYILEFIKNIDLTILKDIIQNKDNIKISKDIICAINNILINCSKEIEKFFLTIN